MFTTAIPAALLRLHAAIPALFTDAPQAIALLDPDGMVLALNDAATDLVGGGLAGSALRALLEDGAESFDAVLPGALAGGRPPEITLRVRAGWGETVEIGASLRRAECDGVAAGVYATLRDLSEIAYYERTIGSALQESRSLFAYSPEPTVEFDLAGRLVRANAAYEALTQRRNEDIVGKTPLEIEGGLDGEPLIEAFARLMTTREPQSYTRPMRRADGSIVVVEGRLILKTSEDEPSGAYAVIRDRTERLRLQARAREHVHRLETLVTVATSAQVSRELIDEAIRSAAASLAMQWAYVGRLDGDDIVTMFSAGDAENTRRFPVGSVRALALTLARHVVERNAVVAVRDLHEAPWCDDASGKQHLWRSFVGIPLRVGGRLFGVLGFVSRDAMRGASEVDDLTFVRLLGALVATTLEREARERRLSEMAHLDALTGLANRAALLDALDARLATLRATDGLAVHYVDLDDFKALNDTRGHAVGDEALREVGARLRGLVRSADLVGRLGGDEFVVVQTVGSSAEVDALADRVVRRLGEPFALEGGEARLGASVGTARARPGESAAALLERADRALYLAKAAGGRGAVHGG